MRGRGPCTIRALHLEQFGRNCSMSEFYERELRDLQRTNGYPVPVRGAEVRATAADRFGRRHSDSDQASKLQSLRYLWTHGFRALRHLPSPLNGECLLCGAAARRGSQSCLPAAGTFIAALRPEIFGVTAHKPCTFPREEIACTDYRGAAFKLLAEIEQRQSKY